MGLVTVSIYLYICKTTHIYIYSVDSSLGSSANPTKTPPIWFVLMIIAYIWSSAYHLSPVSVGRFVSHYDNHFDVVTPPIS